MLEGVKIICERIRVFPEEVPQWKHFMNTQLTDMLTPEEHECIKEALKEHFRQDFNARVLDMLNDRAREQEIRARKIARLNVKHEWSVESHPVIEEAHKYKHHK